MTEDKPTRIMVRDVIVDTDTKARLENAAFLDRTSVSELVRQILTGLVDGTYADLEETGERGSGRARIGVQVDDELWNAADDVAWKRRSSRSALVRLVADHLYGDLPVDRKELKR